MKYSNSWSKIKCTLKLVNLFTFATNRVEYLGHFISSKGVETNPQKIATISCWPTPSNVKELSSFLGLAVYYKKFLKDFALTRKSLKILLKKGAFLWSKIAQHALEELMLALTSLRLL